MLDSRNSEILFGMAFAPREFFGGKRGFSKGGLIGGSLLGEPGGQREAWEPGTLRDPGKPERGEKNKLQKMN